MKTSRYTGKSLEKDLESFNKTLESIDSDWRLIIGYRYNYTAIDLATVEQAARHCCQRTLECGTPRECLASAQRFMLTVLQPVA